MFYVILATLVCTASIGEASPDKQTEHAQQHALIKAEELKSLYDQKVSMTVLDARSPNYFNGILLPDAIWLPHETSEKAIFSLLPSKDKLIVVYCHGIECPASGWLYDRLVSLGYSNVYEYHEGYVDWVKRGYPTINYSES
jgi:rhodanese-related sulfurtransferase